VREPIEAARESIEAVRVQVEIVRVPIEAVWVYYTVEAVRMYRGRENV
jgi:hypothetical protein